MSHTTPSKPATSAPAPFFKLRAQYLIAPDAETSDLMDDFYTLFFMGLRAIEAEAEALSKVQWSGVYALRQGGAAFEALEHMIRAESQVLTGPSDAHGEQADDLPGCFVLNARYMVAPEASKRALLDDCRVLFEVGIAAVTTENEACAAGHWVGVQVLHQAFAVFEQIEARTRAIERQAHT